ncbi:Mut7-C RNAse domain-containing protein [Methanoculleus sp.]|uniref:Mut7-C RNAse domain-containing protein n=1 Tax=Methanoculleus sp. TaxID=90427 RepID=UPI002C7ACC56|nr:Mut7-C RNAse domain-containing protein [Methanoculleus sp.]HNT08085.1 Mut7-C RNAse domain-containing protein [Methanoculleus sp.]
MSQQSTEQKRFLADRMLGTLTRYLRFMGYDTMSANSIAPGMAREDTLLLEIATRDKRLLLTRDRELARRGGAQALYIVSEDVMEQIRQIAGLGLIEPRVRMSRCSICNTHLRPATAREVREARYAPQADREREFSWCPVCRKLYWMGSHGEHIEERLRESFSP